ncbi:MAG: transposase [Candidatus Beckwithbacteria bacterium]|nr:transposase [Patescibacteria group bacterium]
MPSKYYTRNFKPQHFYHVFNRGSYRHKIYKDKEDYHIFTEILAYYLKFPRTRHFAYQKKVNKFQDRNLEKEPTVHLVAYCQMPNHYHLLLKQLPTATEKTNISNLIRRLIVAYSIHFRNKYKHTGSLFEGKFKCVTVDSSEQLIYLSKYIHKHQTTHSSLSIFLKATKTLNWLYPQYITEKVDNYYQFFNSPISEANIEKIKSLIID